ncbi:uncharacterized protein VNE69_08103 [Vairimorpha necatrix]|uniref:Uncharacterized protein n=1 Tax=Vairimorpha necatrix TaxID=6039 RepID=A0AAX4JEE4_9MICR
MTKKDLLKLIEKELNNKTQKQVKMVQTQFEKSYMDIKQYIDNKLKNDNDILKEDIKSIKDIDITSLLETLKNQMNFILEKCNKINEQVKNVHKKINKIKDIKKEIRQVVLKKLEEDTENIKKEFK